MGKRQVIEALEKAPRWVWACIPLMAALAVGMKIAAHDLMMLNMLASSGAGGLYYSISRRLPRRRTGYPQWRLFSWLARQSAPNLSRRVRSVHPQVPYPSPRIACPRLLLGRRRAQELALARSSG